MPDFVFDWNLRTHPNEISIQRKFIENKTLTLNYSKIFIDCLWGEHAFCQTLEMNYRLRLLLKSLLIISFQANQMLFSDSQLSVSD